MKISIVTPCLNSAATIERCVNSVLQDTGDLEYIVVDGASTDGTVEILQRLAKVDPRLSVISKKDRSMTEALNRGFSIASGEVVASLNADDYYVPGAMNRVRAAYPFDVLVGDTRFVDERGETVYLKRPWLASRPLAWVLVGCMTPESSIFFRRSALPSDRPFDEAYRFTQDYELYLRLRRTAVFTYIPVLLSCFEVGASKYSTAMYEQMVAEVGRFHPMPALREVMFRRLIRGVSLQQLVELMTGIRRPNWPRAMNRLRRHRNGS